MPEKAAGRVLPALSRAVTRAAPYRAIEQDRQDELAAAALSLIESAVKTLQVLPDRELTWLRQKSASLPIAMSPGERQAEWGLDVALAAQAEDAELQRRRALRHRPTPEEVGRCLDVYAWLAWLKQQNDGKRDVELLVKRAVGVQVRSLAKHYGRSDDTIRRWHTTALLRIVANFAADIARLMLPKKRD